ncbi:MAG: HAD family phosphatase [Alistipes sp.]|nr:HAD family phosphatase [Alistipes sp.]
MKPLKNIIFDFGGVLVDWNPRYLYDKYFGDEERSEWFLNNICLYSWNLQMDGGKPFAEGVSELQAQHPEWKEAIAIYHTRWVEMMGGEVEGTADLLRRLKAAGYKIYGLTNWSAETFPMIRDTYPVFGEFDGIVVSGEEHLLKPDAAIYRCLLDRYALTPAESIFIDDNEANVAAALDLGLEAHRFLSAAELERSLREDYGLEF